MSALKRKHEKIFDELEQYITMDTDGAATFDETWLLVKYGASVVSFRKELLAEEDDVEGELSVQLGLTEKRETKAITKDNNHPDVYEDSNEID